MCVCGQRWVGVGGWRQKHKQHEWQGCRGGDGGAHSHSQTVELTVSSIWKVFWQILQCLTVTLRPLENNTTIIYSPGNRWGHSYSTCSTAVRKHKKSARQVCALNLILAHLNTFSRTPASNFIQRLCFPLFLHQNAESLYSMFFKWMENQIQWEQSSVLCMHGCMCVCEWNCGILMSLVFLPTSARTSWVWTTHFFSAACYNNLAFKGNEDQLWCVNNLVI